VVVDILREFEPDAAECQMQRSVSEVPLTTVDPDDLRPPLHWRQDDQSLTINHTDIIKKCFPDIII